MADTKKEASVKANEKILELIYDNDFERLEFATLKLVVMDKSGAKFSFPFIDLRDGDMCLLLQGHTKKEIAVYYRNERYYTSYDTVKREFHGAWGCEKTLVRKIDFNILDHTKENK